MSFRPDEITADYLFSVVMDKSRKIISDEVIPAELLYRTIYDQSPDGILVIDTRGRIVDFNEAAHTQLGYSREEFEGISLSDIDPVQTPEEIRASIERVLGVGKAEFEVKHRTKSGDMRDVHVITKVVAVRDGIFFLTIWRDITDRKISEESLRMHRHHLEYLVEERSAELKQLNEELQNDIAERKLIERERESLISDLQEALARIKILTGLLPMCAWCKKVRDDKGYWQRVETYIQEHSDASFTHGICPDCLKKVDPETYLIEIEKRGGNIGERRRHGRRPATMLSSYSVEIISIKNWKKSALDAAIDDFSEGGMCLRTVKPLTPDVLVMFSDGKRIKTGIVIWKKSPSGDGQDWLTGIKFIRDEMQVSDIPDAATSDSCDGL